MNIWKILEIDATDDKKKIKKAYHVKLKKTNPEENPEGFMELRKAYEQALDYAEYDYYEDEYEEDEYEEGQWEENSDFINEEDMLTKIIMSEIEIAFGNWLERVKEVYDNYIRRMDVNEWRKLLYDDIPCQLKHYQRCKNTVLNSFINRYDSVYLPKDVMELMEQFFSYTGTDIERAKNDRLEQERRFNKKVKLNELILFDKLIAGEKKGSEIDFFFQLYDRLCRKLMEYENRKNVLKEIKPNMEQLKDSGVYYLPFECLYTACHFNKYNQDDVDEIIHKLESDFGQQIHTQLLKAEYLCYCGENEAAAKLLKVIYKKVSTKDFMSLYQMAVCCNKVGLYYEAYMLVKQLTWLNPQTFMFQMADEISESIESEYESKRKNDMELSDMEHILMCRMYLRSYRYKEAAETLKKVKDVSKNQWEYNMAKCLCIFNEQDTEQARECVMMLENYVKECLITESNFDESKNPNAIKETPIGNIEKLEWEELQLRYTFEQKKYVECVEKCNELLEEYPISYPVMLLRSYADFCHGMYKESQEPHVHTMGCKKNYRDLDFLATSCPNRVELRLMSAKLHEKLDWYEDGIKILEPVKDKCPVEYEYFRIMLLGEEGKMEEHNEAWSRFFKMAKDTELNITAKSKYYLIDLKRIYDKATLGMYYIYDRPEGEALFKLLKSMEESEYNQPEIYVDYMLLYKRFALNDKAAEVEKQKLSVAKTDLEIHNACQNLIWIYMYNDIGQVEKYFQMIPDKYKESFYETVANAHYRAKNYEKAIEYYLEAKKHCVINIDNYTFLAESYKKLERYDEVVETRLEAIRLCTPSGDYEDEYGEYNVYYYLYHDYREQKKWDEAIDTLNLMMKHTKFECKKKEYVSELTYVYASKIKACKDKGEEKEAQEIMKQVPKKYEAMLYAAIGRTYYKNYENTDEAIRYFYKAIDAGATEEWIDGVLVDTYIYLEKWNEAIEAAKQGVSRNYPGDYWGQYNLYREMVKAYKELKQWDEAIEAVHMMRERSEERLIREKYEEELLPIYRCAMDSYAYEGNIQAAEQLWEKVPDQYKPQIYGSIGFVYYYVNKENEKGVYYLEKAIQEGNSWTWTYGALGKCYERLGKYDEACKVLKQGISYDEQGDYWSDYNLYLDLINLYTDQEKWEELLQVAPLFLEHTKIESKKPKGELMYAVAAIFTGDYIKAYDYFCKVRGKELMSENNLESNIALAGCGLGNWQESAETFWRIAGEDDNYSAITCAIRCYYLYQGTKDEKLWNEIKEIQKKQMEAEQEVEEKAEKEKEEELAECLYGMAELEMALGNDQQAERYVKQADAYFENGEEDHTELIKSYEAWCVLYRQSPKQMQEYVEKNGLREKVDVITRCVCDYVKAKKESKRNIGKQKKVSEGVCSHG